MKVIEFFKYIQLKVTNTPSTGVIGLSNAPFLLGLNRRVGRRIRFHNEAIKRTNLPKYQIKQRVNYENNEECKSQCLEDSRIITLKSPNATLVTK